MAQQSVRYQRYDAYPDWLDNEAPVAAVVTPTPRPMAAAPTIQAGYRKRLTAQKKWIHRILVTALVIGLLQTVRALLDSTFKLIQLSDKRPQLESIYHQAKIRQQHLTEDIHRYEGRAGIEELARNKMDMVGKGEVLVRIFR